MSLFVITINVIKNNQISIDPFIAEHYNNKNNWFMLSLSSCYGKYVLTKVITLCDLHNIIKMWLKILLLVSKSCLIKSSYVILNDFTVNSNVFIKLTSIK